MSFIVELLTNVKENMQRKTWFIILALVGIALTVVSAIFFAGESSGKYRLVQRQEVSKNSVEKKLYVQRQEVYTSARQDIETLEQQRQDILRQYYVSDS